MDNIKEKTTAAINFLEANYKLAEDTVEFFDKRLPALKAVFEEAGRDFIVEEELIMLNNAINWANQLAFVLFRENKLTDEAKTQFFNLVPLKTVQGELNKIGDEREARMNDVLADKKVIDDELKRIQDFNAELTGMTKEEIAQRRAQEEQRNAGMQG